MTKQDLIKDMIAHIGEDPNREGLIETPNRIVRSWDELYSGYNKKVEDVITTFDSEGNDDIILLKNIEFYSMCEHHMLPFYGKAHIAYIPDKRIIGISKLARILDIFARRLQIQERLGMEVVHAIIAHLQPRGAACIIEASHLCMRMRGVGKQESIMSTSCLKGAFFDSAGARIELMGLIKG